MESYILNNGVEMPKVGLGTFDLPKKRITEIVETAYKLGYRKFDTAARYQNECELGTAFKEIGIKREDIFIQTKMFAPSLYYGKYRYGKNNFLNIRRPISIAKCIMGSMERLGIDDYIDMFLIHWPYPDFPKFYRELERFYKEGKIRAIGVSSFLPPHLEYLKEKCSIAPALNQFEISPLNSQKELIAYCIERGIQPEAMSTFSHFRSSLPRLEILANPIVSDIARRLNRSSVQVINKWLLQQGVSIVPKSKDPEHIAENIDLFSFSLSEDDMRKIDSLNRGKFINYDPTTTKWSVPKRYRNNKWFIN